MSIASEIQRLQTAKADIKTAIEGKGVTVPANAKLDTYDTYIASISGGGGTDVSDTTATQSDVLTSKYFYNSSGTRVQGQMANNGSLGTTTLTASTTSKSIPAGYTSGGTVNIDTTNLSAGNIAHGVSLMGLTGSYTNFKYAISGKFQPSSDTTSYSLSSLSLGGLTPKVIIFSCNSASNWRSATEYIISACYVAAGSSSSVTTTFCAKFYSNYVRGYAESNGSSYVSFSRSANAVTISTANSAKLASGKSYQYIILA